MLSFDFSFSKTLNPNLTQCPFLTKLPHPLSKTLTPFPHPPQNPRKLLRIQASSPNPQNPSFNFPHINEATQRPNPSVAAGRSKKKPGGPSTGRIDGNAEFRKQAKINARKKSQKLAENLFYRLKNPNRNHADNFSQEELDAIGLGYDRTVRFMEQDDPNLRHPHDWYKYGEFGPYSWRGVVVGDPVRGRMSDECVSMYGEVKDHEEWDKIDQFEMGSEFSKRMEVLDKSVGFKHFWVFVRHPKWRVSELPWEQWTLVAEVVVETGEKRLDKWSLMGRLGNKTRSMITQCAAWMRPDIIYVKRPVYQCRFEPQADFFSRLVPLLDPSTEKNFLFEVENDDGRVEHCTYFGGLCKIVKASPKWFVDDVVKAYAKMSEEKQFKCLEFLLSNHPIQVLHPYTKEWKVKLEELEMGCDAPDDDDEKRNANEEFVDWIEEDDNDDVTEDDGYEDIAMEGDGEEEEDVDEEELGIEEETPSVEDNEKYWEEELNKALRSPDTMESLVTRSVKASTERYKRQLEAMEAMEEQNKDIVDVQMREVERDEEDDGEMEDGEDLKRSSRRTIVKEKVEYEGSGSRRRIKRGRIPPELFLRAAVRPFTYRNLVKEIVLLRHAIIDGEVGEKR